MTTSTPNQPCSTSNLGLLFRQVRDAMWAQMERELAQAGHDLTFSQFITLKELAIGTAGVTELARAAQLNPGAMTRLLDKLESRGFVMRVADPDDRRALNIHLTEAGTAIWEDIDQCGKRVRERAMAGLSDSDRDQLYRLLEQVRDNLTLSGS
ncbi:MULTISPECIES: MarR family transcriptional regulator [unclassified Lysobacter]|uniref:MarR family winged helix-turn-helix transcriptional regulator n=1 Tax=unclassified Lysobacter TaxID=2635362 RepID=UPI001BE66E7E|nr:MULTISPECIES: MarR family transcriptional regulator [unclassified Lysobacter]MBT2746148.1 MarR family transcriptional regulator [Lysobacter sp. ISL-42]MBT2753146.1 MarR family transcriptional regulator [Lysobacter sp. ISL-50]MBT2776860.1 MarR family transcriptional regulator [Lysobacter sp. ISL-54]MBT2782393.1 MarR family transcriptional regulator [Lysobacter sp. ISL-52]